MNTTDATRGQPLKLRVERRVRELEAIAQGLDPRDPNRQDIEAALAGMDGLLAGDLDPLPAVISADLNLWLERNKHLAEYHRPPAAPRRPVASRPVSIREKLVE
jgi:hypothetical protein